MNEKRRLFFAMEVQAPWPDHLPVGRNLKPEQRHLTLAFLGNVHFDMLLLNQMPPLPFTTGLVGYFNHLLLLPHRHPHVVAWQIEWLEDPTTLLSFQQNLTHWLEQCGFPLRKHEEFLAHVTICRSPFDPHQWKKHFRPLPCFVHHLHLYETVGTLEYQPIWSQQLLAPFEEIEHTADRAYLVRGKDWTQLSHHAQCALAFTFPQLTSYFQRDQVINFEDVVTILNRIIGKADGEIGCPYKSVSFHSDIKEENGELTWEMIVDV